MLTLFYMLLVPVLAMPFNVSLRPAEVVQGDAFLVLVKQPPEKQNKNTTSSPTGRFTARKSEKIIFTKTQNRNSTYIGLSSVDQNLSPGGYAIEVELNGHKQSVELTVLDASFPVERLSLPKGKVTLSLKNSARAEQEAARLGRIWNIRSPAYWSAGFVMPINGKVGTGFGSRRILNGTQKNPHNGVDIKGDRGTPVHALSAGVVVLADDLFFGGNTLVLDHGNALYSFYMHLEGFAVKPGDRINTNDVVGYVGSTGRATGPHLHIGTKLQGVNVNPLSLINLKLEDLWRIKK